MRRILTAALAVLCAAPIALAAAPGASAGISDPTVWGSRVNGICYVDSRDGVREITVSGNPGDSFVFVNLCADASILLSGGVLTGPTSLAYGARATYTLRSTPGTGSMLVINSFGNIAVNVVVTTTPIVTPIRVMHGGLQQVGVPASGDCADVAPSVGHYSEYPFGGWGKSWAYWINAGKGGPVCTRDIYFDQAQQIFRVAGQN